MALLVSTQSLGNTELERNIDNETLAQVRSDYNGLIQGRRRGVFKVFTEYLNIFSKEIEKTIFLRLKISRKKIDCGGENIP